MENECPICLEKLEGTIVILVCKHKYHGKCLEEWFNSNGTISENICPECNIDKDIEAIIEIPFDNRKTILNINLIDERFKNITQDSEKKKCLNCNIL
jgi:hypothetical protein